MAGFGRQRLRPWWVNYARAAVLWWWRAVGGRAALLSRCRRARPRASHHYIADDGNGFACDSSTTRQQRVSYLLQNSIPYCGVAGTRGLSTDINTSSWCSLQAVYLVSVTGTVLLLAGDPRAPWFGDGRGLAQVYGLLGCVMDSRGRLIVGPTTPRPLARIYDRQWRCNGWWCWRRSVEGWERCQLCNPSGIA